MLQTHLLKYLLPVLLASLLMACSDPKTHEPPHEHHFQVGLFGHGRGALGDMRVNYFGLERRCDSCHNTQVKEHGELGTCNRCHQPHGAGWKHSLYAREHHVVLDFAGQSYHEKLTCTECHPNTQSLFAFKNVSCSHCHNHGHSDMDYAHDLMDNYNYEDFCESSNCVACHSKEGKEHSQYFDLETGDAW